MLFYILQCKTIKRNKKNIKEDYVERIKDK